MTSFAEPAKPDKLPDDVATYLRRQVRDDFWQDEDEGRSEARALLKRYVPEADAMQALLDDARADFGKRIAELNSKNEALARENRRLARETVEYSRRLDAALAGAHSYAQTINALRGECEQLRAENGRLVAMFPPAETEETADEQ